MIEVDSGIIDANILMKRVKQSAENSNISNEFYNGYADCSQEEISSLSIKQEMLSIYQKIQMLNTMWNIEEKPIHSERPVIGKLIVFLKKIYRKLTRWQFQIYYQQQTDFNKATLDTLSEMIKVQEMFVALNEKDSEGEKVED